MKQSAKRIRHIAFLVVFLAVIGVSFLGYNVFSKQLSRDNHENRLLTSLPMVFERPAGQWIAGLDEFIADNSPFRHQLISLNGRMNYTLFHATDSDQVLLGKDGWLFYKDGPNQATPVANYQGMQRLDDRQLAQLAKKLQWLSDSCAENGTSFVFAIAPSKDVVYPEYMPDAYPRISQDSLADQLAAYLRQNTTVAVAYDKAALQAAKELVPVYFTGDTHWNNAGAVLATDWIFAAAGYPVQSFEEYTFEKVPAATPDLVNLAALYDLLPVGDDYVPADYPYEQLEQTAVVCGDSFSSYYMPYLQQRFTGADRTDLAALNCQALIDSGADLVILEATERNFGQLCQLLDNQ